MEEFKDQVPSVTWDIPSSFQKEMSAKSKVVSTVQKFTLSVHQFIQVPLGVQMKNEAYLTEKTQNMDSINRYVPSEKSSSSVIMNGSQYMYDNSKLIQVLFFGDQLTVARARGAAVLREPQKSKLDKLEGFVPSIVDWHTRMCFLQV